MRRRRNPSEPIRFGGLGYQILGARTGTTVWENVERDETMRKNERTIKVYEVLIQLPDGPEGPAGDHTFVRRFRYRAEAEACAREHMCYGGPAHVEETDAPMRLAVRWGVA